MNPDEPDAIEYRICGRRSEDNSDIWRGAWIRKENVTEIPAKVLQRARDYLSDGHNKAVWIESRELMITTRPYVEITL